jgi:hypothetical protein
MEYSSCPSALVNAPIEGRYERQPAMIAELIRLPVTVLAVFNLASALAAKQATETLPIILHGETMA